MCSLMLYFYPHMSNRRCWAHIVWKINFCREWGLNRRPLDSEVGVLPTELTHICLLCESSKPVMYFFNMWYPSLWDPLIPWKQETCTARLRHVILRCQNGVIHVSNYVSDTWFCSRHFTCDSDHVILITCQTHEYTWFTCEFTCLTRENHVNSCAWHEIVTSAVWHQFSITSLTSREITWNHVSCFQGISSIFKKD